MTATLKKYDGSIIRTIGESTDIHALISAIRRDIPVMFKDWECDNDIDACSRTWDYLDEAIEQLTTFPENSFWCGTGIASMMYVIE